MKEGKIKVIIFFMTVAVIGLIAIQLYWISNAFKVEEQKFKRGARDALSATVIRLEKQETASVVVHKIIDNDKVVKVIKKDSTMLPEIISFDSSKRKTGTEHLSFGYEINNKKIGDSVTAKVNYFTWNDTSKSKQKVYTIRSRIDSAIEKKRKNVDQIFYQLLAVEPNKSIRKRINPDDVNNILSDELNNQGINLNFLWGINVGETDTLLFSNPGNKIELIKTEFKVRLFPDDLFGTPNYLLLYFPSEKTFVLRNLSVMLSLSATLIILIIFLFYKTITLLIRQKKITEIKNDLINNITHEFKTPISTISLASDSLNEEEIIGNKDSIRRYSKIIADENSRLQGMVENLLNTAVIEKGNIQIGKKEIDIHSVINNVAEKFSVIVENNDGVIRTELKANNYIIRADEFHINAVLNNLIDNAIKFSGKSPKILISTEDVNGNIKISVQDNGIGIGKEYINKIFETFYRIPTGNIHNTKGYGIGLSYVKKMVEAHDGRITVSSKPGMKTIFEIILPVK